MPKYCCAKFCEHVKKNIIVKHWYSNTSWTWDIKVHVFEYGYYEPISYCPFCGKQLSKGE